jgi:hypothetical protein
VSELGRILVLIGFGLAAIGLLVWGLGRVGFRGLPGDIHYQGKNLRFYFPIVTCIVLSIVLTLGLWLWRYLSGR